MTKRKPPTAQAHLWPEEASFNEEIGLWRQEAPGHTTEVAALESVHPGPGAAARLVIAAESGTMRAVEMQCVLEGLARLQHSVREDETFGCFRWYAEESRPKDTNAAFFIGLNLLVLNAGYPDRLTDVSRDLLRAMFERLDVWFDREVAEGCFYYPNKYLGDLVCSCLVKEALGGDYPPPLEQAMRGAGRYWLTEGWGWGEHLSDPYSTVLLNELSALLLLARCLPEDVRALYRDLLLDLLDIDDFFDGGPRVPAVRSYAFREPPAAARFRSLIGNIDIGRHATSATAHRVRKFCFGPLFERLGWKELVGPPDPVLPERSRRIPCFGGAVATAHIAGRFRIGSLSRFPIMPGTDHEAWGLSWQSMPVAFEAGGSSGKADGVAWGFLRWEACEGGVNRFHPARGRHGAHLSNALSKVTTPPPVGQTRALQEGRRLIAIRSMPVLSNAWEHLGDGWDITGEAPEILEETALRSGGSKIVLRLAGGETLSLWHIPISSAAGLASEQPQVVHEDFWWTWRVRRTGASLRENPTFANLWFVGLPGDPDPVVETVSGCLPSPASPVRRIHWPVWGKTIALSSSLAGWSLQRDHGE